MNECVTCKEPEDRWPATHPLYISGGVQCPHCIHFDHDDEKLREHAEVAA